MTCKYCGKYLSNEVSECPYCGVENPFEKLEKEENIIEFKEQLDEKEENTKICPKCGYKNSKKDYYCKSCDYDFSQKISSDQKVKKINSKSIKFKILFIIGIILAICIYMLFEINSYDGKFGTEYSSEEKYMAMLPDWISVPMEYNDILELKGKSQYRVYEEHFGYSGQLFYDETFLDKQCVIGLRFKKDNLIELAYIYECEDKKETEKTVKYIYKHIKNCYGEPNTDTLADFDAIGYVYAIWSDTNKYMIRLTAKGAGEINRVICEIEFYDDFAGIEEETTEYSYTETTAYEWKLNTDSTGYDWISVDDVEKEVWCSNSIAAWRLMGYDIPDGVSAKNMVAAIDKLYEDETYLKYDLTTISEMYAIANNIY